MEKNIRVSILLDIYGKLLTKVQYNFLNDYYNQDLSLSEIAENSKITRQAVRDNIKKGENKLFDLEEKLCVMQRNMSQEEKISKILLEITKIEETSSDAEIAKRLEHVRYELSCVC